MVKNDWKMFDVLICEVFENVIIVNVVIGGFINFVVYLMVIVGWIGIDLLLDDFD